MTYQDLFDKLQNLTEDQLDQEVEITGNCITDEYYDIDLQLSDDGFGVEIILS